MVYRSIVRGMDELCFKRSSIRLSRACLPTSRSIHPRDLFIKSYKMFSKSQCSGKFSVTNQRPLSTTATLDPLVILVQDWLSTYLTYYIPFD